MSDKNTTSGDKKREGAANIKGKEKGVHGEKGITESENGSSDSQSTEKLPEYSKPSPDVSSNEEQSDHEDDTPKGGETEDDIVDEHKEMLKSQESLLVNIRFREFEMSKAEQIRPCDSCEFPDPYADTRATCCWGLCPRPFSRKSVIREYWLVSAPGGETRQEPFDRLNAATRGKNLSVNYKFHIPDFKTGTLNQLIELTDKLRKLDNDIEQVIRKLTEFMYTILEGSEDLSEYFLVHNVDIPTYITRFTWNKAKYPVKKPILVLHDIFKELTETLDHQLKKRSKDYNELDSSLQKIARQQTGTILTRSLVGIVKKEDFILDSDFLTTILVVVPNSELKEWMKTYETLAEMVVPQSATKLYEDQNHSLFSVAIYKKSVGAFKKNARDKRFTVRDYDYSEADEEKELDIQETLQNLRKVQIAVLYRWIKVNFSDSFSAWIHVKALRVFVESVLRFGLPVNYQAMLLVPLKSRNKLKDVLNDLFKGVDCSLSSGYMDDIPGALRNFGVSEYFPYVFFTIVVNIYADGK